MDTKDAMLEHPTTEEGAKLLLDEARGESLSVCGAHEETCEMLANDPVKKSLLRFTG